LFILLVSGLFWSCSVNKNIRKNDYLVNKYTIRIEPPVPQIEAGDLRAFIKPKPNKKLLFLKISAWAYYKNLKHPSKINGWLDKNFGEPPVFFYREDADKSVKKMKRYLADIGYVNAKIGYKLHYKKKKVNIDFTVIPAKPYRIDTIRYDIPDTTIQRFVFNKISHSLIKKGDIYNAYTLDDERDRITEELRNNGYYYFNRNYIQFVIDSNYNDRKMTMVLHIFDRKEEADKPALPHIRYFIKNVIVTPDFNPLINQYDTIKHVIRFPNDTTAYTYLFAVSPRKMFYPSTFNQTIKIKPDMPYSASDVQQTYRRIFNFPILSTANILFDTIHSKGNSTIRYMNSRIEMQTAKLNRFSIEAVGTNLDRRQSHDSLVQSRPERRPT